MIQSLLFQFRRLYLFFALLFASFFTINSTNDISVAPAEPAEVKSEKASKKVRKRDTTILVLRIAIRFNFYHEFY